MNKRLYTETGLPKGYDSLFLENTVDRDRAMVAAYTLNREDVTINSIVYPSLYKLYMSCEDLTEWEFADKYLAGWEHLEKLQTNKKFVPILDSWRKDLEQKLKSRAFRAIQLIAEEGGKNSFEANKLILTGKWKEIVNSTVTSSPGRGRPSKRELDKLANEEYEASKSIREDLKRLGIEVN